MQKNILSKDNFTKKQKNTNQVLPPLRQSNVEMFSCVEQKKWLPYICHWSCMSADPINTVQWRGRQIILTATKDMLTLSSVDETDKSDNSSGSLAHNEAMHTMRRSLTDVIMLLLRKTCPSYLAVATSLTDSTTISKMWNF